MRVISAPALDPRGRLAKLDGTSNVYFIEAICGGTLASCQHPVDHHFFVVDRSRVSF